MGVLKLISSVRDESEILEGSWTSNRVGGLGGLGTSFGGKGMEHHSAYPVFELQSFKVGLKNFVDAQ